MYFKIKYLTLKDKLYVLKNYNNFIFCSLLFHLVKYNINLEDDGNFNKNLIKLI